MVDLQSVPSHPPPRSGNGAKSPSLNEGLSRQSFVLDASHRFTPGLTVTFSETFFLAHDTNLASPEGVATGRNRSYTNVIEPGVR